MPLPSWREPVDVLVVGAGAAGAAFTWSVSREGLQVLCLEQGDWVDPASYATTRADWEAARQAEWHPDPNVRRLAADYPIQASESPISPSCTTPWAAAPSTGARTSRASSRRTSA